MQEDRAQADQKHPCQGPDAAPSGNCCIAEVSLTTGQLGADGGSNERIMWEISKRILIFRAGGKAELVLSFLFVRFHSDFHLLTDADPVRVLAGSWLARSLRCDPQALVAA